MFRIGQQVVCISDAWITPVTMACPKADRIYTVKRNVMKPWGEVPYGIELFEIVNINRHWIDGVYPPFFDAKYFRPLEYLKVEVLQHEAA